MRKSTTSLLYATMLFKMACTGPSVEKLSFSDLKRNGIHGDVEHIKTLVYDCDSLGVETKLKECCVTHELYNEKGLRVTSISLNADGDTLSRDEIEPFPNGLAKSISTFVANKRMRQIVFTLNDSGLYNDFKVYDSAANMMVQGINVNQTELGSLTSFQMVDANQKLLETEFNYFENNHLKRSVKLNPSGDTISLYTARYNEKGEGIEERYYNFIDGKPLVDKIQHHSYSGHDKFGNWTRQIQYDDSGRPTQVTKREFVYRQY